MFKFNSNKEQRVTRFRTWKSGKFWLFGASIMAMGALAIHVQAFASETQPTTLDTTSSPPTADQATGDNNPFNAVDQLTADQVVNGSQEVRIHYTPNQGDNGNYYAWVWGDTANNQNNGRFLPLVAGSDGKHTLTVTPDKNINKFNYIITNKNDWNGVTKVSGEQDMTAGVNNVTATDIYHSADGWYSQFQNVQTDEFDRKFGYTDKVVNDKGEFETVGSAGNLGATLNEDGTATLNLWAPTAKSVELNIYSSVAEDAPLLKTVNMTRGGNYSPTDHTQNTVGLWSIKLTTDLIGNGLSLDKIAYDYKLTIPKAYFIQKTEDWYEETPGVWKKRGDKYLNTASVASGKPEELSSNSSIADIAKLYAGNDQVVTIQDPYSQATVKNGKRSVIVNPSKIGDKVTNSNNVRVNSKTELSVVEVDIRDFSIDPSSGVSETNKGNYLGFVESGTTNPQTGQKTGIDYLKYLGAKYIQMMPIYDFQTVPELPREHADNNRISTEFSADDQQNWGYDPKNYNVPEGSYSTDPDNPTNRIAEVKTMVQKLHDAGINIIMDVVYNHLYDGQNNPFEYTVPGYYYAMNGDGKMNNDIGVGNAVRTNSEMMRQYIVNSVAYWALEYGMDGFRFDAMSDLDTDTMNAIRTAINKIDKRIVTYGEGWDSMGKYLNKDGDHPSSVSNAAKTPEVGFFDSIGRDAISGSHYDHGNPPGFVNTHSDYKHDPGKLKVLTDSLMGGHGRSLINASQQLNYVEVHDGMTLSDLLKHYNPNDTAADHLNRVELATAMSALSQGIHFSQHGQEFLRTKMNSHNTYNAGDEKNKINWGLVSENADAVNFTKSLISLRQNEPLWHLSDYGKEVFSHMTITNAQENSGIITFELRQDNDDKYLVIFNNNTSSENNSSLTLGPGNYYYGNDISKGRINYSNDFTNAFIVTSNSKNLYDKIGKINGEQTITLDKLSATVLYIPRVRIAHQEHVTQTIHYINKQQETVAENHVQKVTKAIIEQVDPNQKFTYTSSGIGAKDERVLGHRENILSHVNKENTPIRTTYYATDGNGNLVETTVSIRLADSGLPINSNGVTWVREDALNFKAVKHPEIDTYRVVASTDSSNDLVKVPEKAIDNHEITVTYAKESVAYLIANNDPDKLLPTTKDEALTGDDKHVKGVEGEAITLSDSNLAREGYSYTVNNYPTLAEAIQATNEGKFALTDREFTVTYTAKTGHIDVIYLDGDNQNTQVKRDSIQGNSDQALTFSPSIPDNYQWVSDNRADVTQFDRLDDTTTPSQTITVYLRHKHQTSTLTTTHTVDYQGKDNLTDKAVTINWTVDTDLVTQDKTYTPQTQGETIASPKQEGFRVDKKQVTIAPLTQTEQPLDAVTVVTYTAVPKPRIAFDTRIRYTLDGQEQTEVPNPETSTKVSETVTTQGQEAVYNWNADKEEWELTTPATQQVVTHAYVTKTGTITVVYLDQDKQSETVKQETLSGQYDQALNFSPSVPDNYEWVSDNRDQVTQFDRLDDATTPSQTITVYLRHKHQTSTLTTTHTVDYKGKDNLTDKVVTINWTVDTDLVTQDKTYTPQTQGETIASPKQEGFRVDKKQVTIAPLTQTEQPLDAVTVVTYTPVPKPSTAFDTRTRYTLDGQEQPTVPNPETSTKVSETITAQGQEAVYNWNADKEEWALNTPATQQVVTHAYVTKTGTITVVYLDQDKQSETVKQETLSGQYDQALTFSPSVPDNYEWVSDNRDQVTQFDRLDDATTPSQTITVYLRHKHQTSTLTTTHTVDYQGKDNLTDKVVTINWTVDTDLVTQDKTYTPQTQGETIASPKQEGFRVDKKQVTIAPLTQTEQPLDAVTVVTYTAVPKPSTAFDTRTRYTLDGQEQTEVPNPETSTKVSETITTQGQEAVYNWNADKEEWELTTPATQQVVTHAYVTKTVKHKQNGSGLTSEEKPSVTLQDTIEKKDGLIIKTTWANVNGQQNNPTLIKQTAVTDNLTTEDFLSAKLTHKNGSGLTSEEKPSVTLQDTIEKKDGLNIKTTWANVNGEQSQPTLIKQTAVTDNLTTDDLPSAKLIHKNGSSLTSEEKPSVMLQDTIEKKDGLNIKATWANVNGQQSQPILIKQTAVTDNLTTEDLPSAKLTHKNGSGLTSEEKPSVTLQDTIEKKDGLIIKATWANVNGEQSQPTLIKQTAVTDNLTTEELPSAKLTHKNGSGLTSEEKPNVTLYATIEKKDGLLVKMTWANVNGEQNNPTLIKKTAVTDNLTTEDLPSAKLTHKNGSSLTSEEKPNVTLYATIEKKDGLLIKTTWANVNGEQSQPTLIKQTAVTDNLSTEELPSVKLTHKNGSTLTSEEKPSVTLQDTIENKDGLNIKTTWANINGESQPTLIKKTAVTDNLTTEELPSAKLIHKNGSGLTSEEKPSISLQEILEKPTSSKPSLTQEFGQQLFEHTESNLGKIAKQDKQIGMSDDTLSTESQNHESKEHHLPRTADAPQTHLTLLGLGLASLATYLKKRKED